MRWTLPAPALLVLLAAGCSSPLPPATVPLPSPAAAPAVSLTDRFVTSVTGTYGYSEMRDPDGLLELGRLTCIEIAKEDSTQSKVIAAVDAASGEVSPLGARVIIDAARLHLCPGKTYAANRSLPIEQPTYVAIPTPTVAPVPPAPPGPPTFMTQGTYEVGVDVAPGKYKTTGSELCYWARLRNNDGGLDDIIDNNFGAGQQVTTVRKGEYFETKGCGSWSKAG